MQRLCGPTVLLLVCACPSDSSGPSLNDSTGAGEGTIGSTGADGSGTDGSGTGTGTGTGTVGGSDSDADTSTDGTTDTGTDTDGAAMQACQAHCDVLSQCYVLTPEDLDSCMADCLDQLSTASPACVDAHVAQALCFDAIASCGAIFVNCSGQITEVSDACGTELPTCMPVGSEIFIAADLATCSVTMSCLPGLSMIECDDAAGDCSCVVNGAAVGSCNQTAGVCTDLNAAAPTDDFLPVAFAMGSDCCGFDAPVLPDPP